MPAALMLFASKSSMATTLGRCLPRQNRLSCRLMPAANVRSGHPRTALAVPLPNKRHGCLGHLNAPRRMTTVSAASQAEGGLEHLEKSYTASQAAFSTVAEADEARFQLHPSVKAWKHWKFDESLYTSTPELVAAAAERVTSIVSSTARDAAFGSTTAAYWAFHSAKNVFFASQGLASIAYTSLQLRLRGEDDAQGPYPINNSARARLLCEAYEMFRQDLTNIQQGVYKLPWDMTNLQHRQYNPLYALTKASEFIQEANLTLSRRKAQKAEPVWMKSGMYPDYYLSTFHYQTDGWLSSKSASIYETSTETLFIGRQDAMQRQSLVPIHEWLESTRQDSAGMKLLEVGCGTGRFHTFIKDNYPLMHTAALDLSPYYLQEARENVDYWRRMTGSRGAVRGGTEFLHAAAESIPMEDASCDVVMSVYMFHEMPAHAQQAAAREMTRVLKPGGLLVLCDSIQRGDRPAFDPRISNFTKFNEPHYENYVDTDMGAMFESNGLEPYMKLMASSTKVLSFKKA